MGDTEYSYRNNTYQVRTGCSGSVFSILYAHAMTIVEVRSTKIYGVEGVLPTKTVYHCIREVAGTYSVYLHYKYTEGTRRRVQRTAPWISRHSPTAQETRNDAPVCQMTVSPRDNLVVRYLPLRQRTSPWPTADPTKTPLMEMQFTRNYYRWKRWLYGLCRL